MRRVLVALGHDFNRQTIVEILQLLQLDIISFNEFTPTNDGTHIDLCIVDLTHWETLTRLNFVPLTADSYCLLLITEEDLNQLPNEIENQINEIITLPLRARELKVRLQNLLRMKEQSEKQQQIYNKLAISNKALESTSDAIIISDNDGVSIYINPAFISKFGYTINELNVRGIPNTLFQDSIIGKHVFREVREQKTWTGDVELKTKSGDFFPFLLKIDTILNERDLPIGFISILTDITQHRRINVLQAEQRILAEAQLDTAKALTSTLDMREVFERMLDNISEVVPNDAANIILIKDGRVELVDRDDYADKEQIEALKSGRLPISHYDDLKKIMETNAPLIVRNTKQYLDTKSDIVVHTPWLNSHIGIPIRLHNEVIGFLNVDTAQPNTFSEAHVESLQLFAEQAAIAIHNADLHQRAKKLAILEERQRLARNLHDAVSQTLFSASLIADALPQLWHSNPDEILPRLEQIRTLNRGALAEMRTLLLELHPERLLDTEIIELLEQLAEGVLGHTYLDVTIDVNSEIKLPSNIQGAVYYITQEALNNVIKHAEADHVVIHLHDQRDQFLLTIHDDGRGFDVDQVAPTQLGLNNIRERANATQADLTIESSPEQGTRISLSWSKHTDRRI